MTNTCEFLERRRTGDDDEEFDHERPYCTAADAFVQPMRADVCVKRYGLDPETDCEFYREAKGLGSVTSFGGGGESLTGDEGSTDTPGDSS